MVCLMAGARVMTKKEIYHRDNSNKAYLQNTTNEYSHINEMICFDDDVITAWQLYQQLPSCILQ